MPADAGQLACLVAIDDADYIIQDEILLKRGVTKAASLSFELFNDSDSSEKLPFASTKPKPATFAKEGWYLPPWQTRQKSCPRSRQKSCRKSRLISRPKSR